MYRRLLAHIRRTGPRESRLDSRWCVRRRGSATLIFPFSFPHDQRTHHHNKLGHVVKHSFKESHCRLLQDTHRLRQITKRKQERRRRAPCGTNPYGLPPFRRSLSCLCGWTTRSRHLRNRISLARNEAGLGELQASRMATTKRHFRSYLRSLKTHDLMSIL